MKRITFLHVLVACLVFGSISALLARTSGEHGSPDVAAITVDYPLNDSLFPPDITSPTFIWRDAAKDATSWRVDVTFADGSPSLHVVSEGKLQTVGEIDKRCISNTNELPKLTPEQAEGHTWVPDSATWNAIKKHSVAAPATVTISGLTSSTSVVSHGQVTIQTSKDPVGAPIFYRDVPLMPSETEKGVIKPLAANAVHLIQWRLRNVSQPSSRVVLENIHSCANCHSFSADGKTLGMDMDGPANDKGLYALVPLKPETTIRNQDMVSWNPTQELQYQLNRVAFMSQVSPDGRYVVTTVSGAERAPQNNFYVVNFKDYKFLQVFYPTRGMLAWYSRENGTRHLLPGADDPQYIQTDGVWSPDGKYIVFARAEAKDPYPADGQMADYANDPREVQVKYDLYRIPFNDGKGGTPEPIRGASANGMSNTFPKISPDGRWIVFVKNKNGQLMRPDSELYIVPVQGGEARRLSANTSRMNSWHSFSPNGRWLVFSSKARSPYTQMYLTHIDENGNDSPAILIENSTAANRAVNIPEFVNISPDTPLTITAPAVDTYRKFDNANDLAVAGKYEEAVTEWRELVKENPDDSRMQNNLGAALARLGRYQEAIPYYQKALELNPQYYSIYNNLGRALAAAGRVDEAVTALNKGLELYPDAAELHNNLGRAFAIKGQFDEAAAHFARAVQVKPDFAEANVNLGSLLLSAGEVGQATARFRDAVKSDPRSAEAHCYLGTALYYGEANASEALSEWRQALAIDPNHVLALSQAAHALAAAPVNSLRNGAEAVKLAQRAVALSGSREPVYLDTLAMAYAEAGQFTQAIETARKAQLLAFQQNQPELANALAERMKLYEAGQPYRDQLHAGQ